MCLCYKKENPKKICNMADEKTSSLLREWNFDKYVEIFKGNYMCHSRAAFRYSLYYRFSVLAVNIGT